LPNFSRRGKNLHNENLWIIFTLQQIFSELSKQEDEVDEHTVPIGEMINAYKFLFGKPERKRPLWRPRREREDNIKIDLREICLNCDGWIQMAQNGIQ
jgi:hypothetical protein